MADHEMRYKPDHILQKLQNHMDGCMVQLSARIYQQSQQSQQSNSAAALSMNMKMDRLQLSGLSLVDCAWFYSRDMAH